MAGPGTVPQALARTRPLVRAGLESAVQRLAPPLARVAGYHLGWLDAEGRETLADGGKALRPTITLLAGEAVGAPAEDAVPGAVALELVHNFSLIHDDVMDGDAERRHRPTVWALFGVGEAIVSGDALAALAYAVLLDVDRPEAHRAARELSGATLRMIEGQSQDLAFESRVDVTEQECLEMATNKTGALISCAAALGAILGGGAGAQIDALRSYGRDVGVAFQAIDDLLGTWGEPEVTGKPSAGDLRQHKKTFPVVHALAAGGSDARELAEILSDGDTGDAGAVRALELLDRAGSRAWTESLAERHLRRAMDALAEADLAKVPVAELGEIASVAVGRNF
jgi:geranylgeranyl diphosphate synthase type I